MRGFLWGFLFAAVLLVGLIWTGVLSVRYTGSQSIFANAGGYGYRSTAYAAADPIARQNRLPEIRVLNKDEP